MKDYNASKIFNESTQSASVHLDISPTDVFPKLWGGRTLTAGTYEIWYDDLRAFHYKLDLVSQYNLKGTAHWALGQEDLAVWDIYAQRKKTTDFHATPPPAFETATLPVPGATGIEPFATPVELSEAPVPSHITMEDINGIWAENAIKRVVEKGWMVGTLTTTFEPHRELTRAEMARAMMNITDLPNAAFGEDFSDTANHWAREDIKKARYYGILQGRGENQFEPNLSITRQDVAVIIDRVFQLAQTVDFNNNNFSDINKDMYSYNSIITLAENNIVSGYPNGAFEPFESITRAELAAIFDKLSGYGIKDFSVFARSFMEPEPLEPH